jgi:hypothetical protein
MKLEILHACKTSTVIALLVAPFSVMATLEREAQLCCHCAVKL